MLALRTPDGRSLGEKSWPLAGTLAFGQSPYAGVRQPIVIPLVGGDYETYEQVYRSQVWVYAVVNKLSRAISSIPLKTYSGSAADDREEEKTAPVAKLIKKPYPYGSAYKLKEWIVSSVGIYGNATLVKFRGGNGQTPVELWPMPWRNVEVILGTDRPIEAYRYVGRNGVRKLLHPDDVMHFSWYNPNPDQPYGVSPIEPLATTLQVENAGARYAVSSYANAARPASYIKSVRNLSKEQRKDLRAEIEGSYGGPENAFKVALLDNGLEWLPLGGSASDGQVLQQRQLSQVEVCAAYDMPPPMVGILEHATFSNIDQQHWMLYMDTLAPICSLIESVFMSQLIDLEPAWDGYFTEFDMDAKLRGNFEQRSQTYVRMLQSGAYTPNDIRHLENRPKINDPAADALYVPVNLEPVSPAMRKLQEAELAAQTAREHEAQILAAAEAGAPAPAGGTRPIPPPTPAPPPKPGPRKPGSGTGFGGAGRGSIPGKAERLMRNLLGKDDIDSETHLLLTELREALKE